MSAHDYAASAAAVRELLRGGGEFVEPLLRRIQGLWPPAAGDTNDF